MAIYYDTNEYIEEFDINTKIVDTEERNKMCELWTELAYSKIYLMSLCYDESDKEYRWYKEPPFSILRAAPKKRFGLCKALASTPPLRILPDAG